MPFPDEVVVTVATPVAALSAAILAESGVEAVGGFAAQLAEEAVLAAAQATLPFAAADCHDDDPHGGYMGDGA